MKQSWKIAAIPWKLRKLSTDQGFFQHLEEILLNAKEKGAEVVLLPENINYEFLTLFNSVREEDVSELLHPYSEAVEIELKRYSKESGMIIVGGTHYFSEEDKIINQAIITTPDGKSIRASKNKLTEYEKTPLALSQGVHLSLLPKKELGVLVCYDSEFPQAADLLVDNGMQILLVPFFTDSMHGYHRIRYAGLARAVENQCYVVQAGLCGSLGFEPCVKGIGRGSFFAPPIEGFPEDGVLCEGKFNEEEVVIYELSLEQLLDAQKRAAVKNPQDRKKLFTVSKT